MTRSKNQDDDAGASRKRRKCKRVNQSAGKKARKSRFAGQSFYSSPVTAEPEAAAPTEGKVDGEAASSSPAPPVSYDSGRAGVHTRALAAELSYIVKVFGDYERGTHVQNRYSDIVKFLEEYRLPAESITEAFKIAASGEVPF